MAAALDNLSTQVSDIEFRELFIDFISLERIHQFYITPRKKHLLPFLWKASGRFLAGNLVLWAGEGGLSASADMRKGATVATSGRVKKARVCFEIWLAANY